MPLSLFMEGHLGWVCILPVVHGFNEQATDCKTVLDITTSFPLAAGPAMELLGHTEDLFLVSWSTAPLFLIMAVLICNFTNSVCTPFCPRPWPHLLISVFLMIAILSQMLSHSGFAFPFFIIMCLFSTNSFDCSCNWTKTKYWKDQLLCRTFCEFKYLIRPSENPFATLFLTNYLPRCCLAAHAAQLTPLAKRRPCFDPGNFAFTVLSTQKLTFFSSPLFSSF